MSKPPILGTRLLKLALAGGLLAALSVHVDGCTIIGLEIGTATDRQYGTGDTSMLARVRVGRSVRLLLYGGRRVEGRFLGWSRDSGVTSATGDSTSLRGKKVRLETPQGEVAVPAEDIAQVSIDIYDHRLAGMLVGFAMDVMMVQSAKASHRDDCGGRPPSLGW